MNEPSLIDQRYLRKELIGKGGMGQVYRAYDTIVQRDVAIKFLKSGSLADSKRRDRFKREIKLLAQYSNSYIVPLYGYGNLDQDDHNNPPFVVMQLMNKSLDQILIENNSVDFPVIVYILDRIGLATDFIHARQIVHRDIKPENIFLDTEQFCYLGDFGIAHQADEFSITENGPIGSAHYMSPEQVLGKELDGRSDIYSLGGLLYTLLTGKRPFAELGSRHEIKQAHLEADRPFVTFEHNRLFTQINPILRKAMAINSADRYASAKQFVDDLKRLLNEQPLSVNRPPPDFYTNQVRRSSPFFYASGDPLADNSQQTLLTLGMFAILVLLAGITFLLLPVEFGPAITWGNQTNTPTLTATVTHTFTPPLTLSSTPSPTATPQTITIITNGENATWKEKDSPNRFVFDERLIPVGDNVKIIESKGSIFEFITPDNGRYTLGPSTQIEISVEAVRLIKGDLLLISSDSSNIVFIGRQTGILIEIEEGWLGVRLNEENKPTLQIDCIAILCEIRQNTKVIFSLKSSEGIVTDLADLNAKTTIDEAKTADYIDSSLPEMLSETPTPVPTITLSPTQSASTPVMQRSVLAPTSLSPTGSIAYTCFVDGIDQICSIDVETRQVQQLTFNEQTDFYPAYNFASDTITFSSRRLGGFQLYSMDPFGNDQQLIGEGAVNGYAPELSPDGSKLVYAITNSGNGQIWVYDLQTGLSRMLTEERFTDQDPSWSHDGETIVYVSDRTGFKRHYIVDVTGQNDRLIETDIANLGGRSDLSPDGNWLAVYAGDKKRDIFLIPVNGGEAVQLTNIGDNLAPSFSADGEWIVFSSYRLGDQDSELYVVRVDGTMLTKITDNDINDWQPRWSP